MFSRISFISKHSVASMIAIGIAAILLLGGISTTLNAKSTRLRKPAVIDPGDGDTLGYKYFAINDGAKANNLTSSNLSADSQHSDQNGISMAQAYRMTIRWLILYHLFK
jgi:hypothetical protein